MGTMRFDRFKTSRYVNGNYIVKISSMSNTFFGISKRALRVGEDLLSEFPDSIDLKISNRCSHGCKFCHESSIPGGDILDIEKTKSILSQLPKKPIEIAVGGGNVLECLDETEDILGWLVERGYNTRITITLDDLKSSGDPELDERIVSLISSKVGGLGISVTSDLGRIIEEISKKKDATSYYKPSPLDYTDLGKELSFGPQIVFHVIAGITSLDYIKYLIENTRGSVLVLGYKQWGRALNNKLPDLSKLREYIGSVIKDKTKNDLTSLGFDNLGIEQLGIKDMIGENKWKGMYLGDEGTCSMYIDAVKGEFARTSRSPERVSWNNIKLLDYYASLSA